jgi:hypothetical protein
VAAKPVVNPFGTLAVLGVTAIDTKAGGVTVKVMMFDEIETELVVMSFFVALISPVPTAKVDATPMPFRVAEAVLLECQMTEPETSPVDMSVYVAVAVKVTGLPLGDVVAVEVSVKLVMNASFTVRST